MKILVGGLTKGGFLDRFRFKPWNGKPDNLQNEGRAWYDTLLNKVGISYRRNGEMKVAHLLDSRLKWVDMVASIDMGSVQGNLAPTWMAFIGGIEGMAFKAGRLNVFQATYHFNHDYALNTPIFPHIHWCPTVQGDTGTVRWGLELAIAKGHGQDIFDNTITLYIEQASDGTAFKHMVAEADVGWWDEAMEPDAVIVARIFRDGTHPNDTAGDIFAFTADIHHQIDDTGTNNKSPDFYS